MEQYHMLDPDGRVVAVVSGGADPVCLLALLRTFREPQGVRLRVLHVHYGFRGGGTDRGTDFVRPLCEGFHVSCYTLKVDVRGLTTERGISEEEAGRFLRYKTLERGVVDWGDEDRTGPDGDLADNSVRPVRIAVAHHSEDQAETILYNLFRGSGLSGTKGIAYRRGGIIRPLLDVDRGCILKWLANHGLSYVRDSTNDTLHYTQNRIRDQLLPEIKQYVNRGATGNTLRLGYLAAQADKCLENRTTAWIKAHVRKDSGAYIPAEALLGEPGILRSYVVVSLLRELGGTSRDLGPAHVSQVMELAGRSVGKQVDLPYGLVAIRKYGGT